MRTFFALYKEGCKQEAREYRELAEIALIPKMDPQKYYLPLWEKYNLIINGKRPELPPIPGGPVLDAGSTEAHLSLKHVVRNLKQVRGHG